MLASAPTIATISIRPVSTSLGLRSRSIALINTQTPMPTSSRALASAASTSARCQPNVRLIVAARVAREAAIRASTRPLASVSM